MPDDAAPAPRKNPGGRPRHVPTPQTRQEVTTLSGLGQPNPAIARRIGISESTLSRYYRAELTKGADEANTQVVQSIWNAAVGIRLEAVPDPQQPGREMLVRRRVDPNMTAAIYWTKTRMGWREVPTVHHHVGSINLDYATTEEKEREIEALIHRRAAAIAARREEDALPEQPVGLVH